MTSGIRRSQEKIEFARDFLRGRVVRGSFEKNEYYSRKNVLVRDKNRKDRGIRRAVRFLPDGSILILDKSNRQSNCSKKNRFYGIQKSQEKIEFARDFLRGRVVRGSFEKNEYYSQKNVLVRDKNRKDRGIRQAFRRTGKAPAVLYYSEESICSEEKPKQLIKEKY